MKKNTFLSAAFMSLLMLSFTACSNDDLVTETTQDVEKNSSVISTTASVRVLEVEGLESDVTRSANDAVKGTSKMNIDSLNCAFAATDSLIEEEIEFLYALYQKEKVERDLLTFAAQKYPNEIIFSRIAEAGKNHLTASERILSFYNLEIPEEGAEGTYSSESLQTIYNTGIASMETLSDTYKVLMGLEEANIVNFADEMEKQTNTNLLLILENLSVAARNHIRVFNNALTDLNEVYTPTLLDQATYDTIINAEMEHGKSYKNNGQGQNNIEKGGQASYKKGQENSSNQDAGQNQNEKAKDTGNNNSEKGSNATEDCDSVPNNYSYNGSKQNSENNNSEKGSNTTEDCDSVPNNYSYNGSNKQNSGNSSSEKSNNKKDSK